MSTITRLPAVAVSSGEINQKAIEKGMAKGNVNKNVS